MKPEDLHNIIMDFQAIAVVCGSIVIITLTAFLVIWVIVTLIRRVLDLL